MKHYFGKLDNTSEAEGLNPHFAKAFEFLRRRDLATMPLGRYDLEPNDIAYAMVQECELKCAPADGVFHLEAHGKYIDIQAPVSGEESFGIGEIDAGAADYAFDAGRDVGFADLGGELKTLHPGEFAVFFPPSDGHAPCLTVGAPRTARKVVVKILA